MNNVKELGYNWYSFPSSETDVVQVINMHEVAGIKYPTTPDGGCSVRLHRGDLITIQAPYTEVIAAINEAKKHWLQRFWDWLP